jgi:hypothetical protein
MAQSFIAIFEDIASRNQDFYTIAAIDGDLRDDPDRIASTTGEVVKLSSGPSRLRHVHEFAMTVYTCPLSAFHGEVHDDDYIS